MSIGTLPVRLRNPLDHDRGERGFEVDTHVVLLDDPEHFEHVDGVEPDLRVFSFYRSNDADVPGPDLGVSGGYLESGFTPESDAGVVVVLAADEIRPFEGSDEIVAHDHPLGRVPFREEVGVVREVSVQESGEYLDGLEHDEKLVIAQEELYRNILREYPGKLHGGLGGDNDRRGVGRLHRVYENIFREAEAVGRGKHGIFVLERQIYPRECRTDIPFRSGEERAIDGFFEVSRIDTERLFRLEHRDERKLRCLDSLYLRLGRWSRELERSSGEKFDRDPIVSYERDERGEKLRGNGEISFQFDIYPGIDHIFHRHLQIIGGQHDLLVLGGDEDILKNRRHIGYGARVAHHIDRLLENLRIDSKTHKEEELKAENKAGRIRQKEEMTLFPFSFRLLLLVLPTEYKKLGKNQIEIIIFCIFSKNRYSAQDFYPLIFPRA